MRVVLVALLMAALGLLSAGQHSAQAENLNQLNGPSWDCTYLTYGEPIYADCRKCNMATEDFWRDTPTSGHCVPKSSTGGLQRTPAPAPPPQRSTSGGGGNRREYYGAAAAGLWRDSDGDAHVASGIAWNYRTKAEAEAEAMSRCENAGGENCRIVGSFDNGGCGYISVGHNDGGVHYGVGPTEEEAQASCEANGYECKPANGGCTSRPN